MECLGSVLTNKYSEGQAWFGITRLSDIDEVEHYAKKEHYQHTD